MSGLQFFKEKITASLDRRSFLLRAGLLCTGIAVQGCINKIRPWVSPYAHIKGSLNGPNAIAGHILRDNTVLPAPSYSRKLKTLIIGGGISGLSAGRWLKAQGHQDFEILDLETGSGGNAMHGQNEVSAYPLGAHYVTIANNHDQELLDFYQACGLITRYENGLPLYNEFALCFDPEERLLIKGQWQEGLIPNFGVPLQDKAEIKRFLELTEALKQAKGKDGKYAFDIPLDKSSADAAYRDLDKVPFSTYLKNQGFSSPYLSWYLEYCCKDDYGQKIDKVSAWAGLHYFAGRKGKAGNAESTAILTWPEGNGWLVKQLATDLKDHIKPASLTYRITEDENSKVTVSVYDLHKRQSYYIIADKVILASPQYVNDKLLREIVRPEVDYSSFNYAPWLVANVTVNGDTNDVGTPLCWDNVAYDTPSVGYVNANHQHLKSAEGKRVITYYLPLCDYEPRVSRLAAFTRTYEQWLDIILPELEFMHPNIIEKIEALDCWVWGHGMISPSPNSIWGQNRKNAQQSINDKIFFAHTDLSGISIFEEAFHQGIRAAKEVLFSYAKS